MPTLSKFKRVTVNKMNKHVGIMHIHVYFFLTRILYVFTCFRYSWSDSISTSHCNICFTNGTNTPLPRLSLSLRSFRHSMAVWRIPAYGLVMVNSRFIMTTKHHHVHTYANYLIVTVSNEKLVKTICSSFISNSPESVDLNFESCMSCLPTSKAWICRLTFTPDLSLRSLQCCVHRVPRNFSLTSLFFRC